MRASELERMPSNQSAIQATMATVMIILHDPYVSPSDLLEQKKNGCVWFPISMCYK